MYRQILKKPDQCNLQLILWRDAPDQPVRIYRLNTVTYGVSSAPYLSIRYLHQLAQECNNDVIARVIREDFYVDDLITGDDQISSLVNTCNETAQTLLNGCFSLRKWTFNHDVQRESIKNLNIGDYCQFTTLGLGWSNQQDTLHFTTQLNNSNNSITKRSIMSKISQIYDPLGLLSPSIIIAKILLQKLWLNKLNWDDAVPLHIAASWSQFINSLNCLSDVRIPRYAFQENTESKELHIFSDASQEATGACAYVRCQGSQNSVRVWRHIRNCQIG